MKITDYIVEFLISKGITDVFGYPGGVICHFIDSLTKYPEIKGHINYNEQGSSFAACGYAQETGKLGVAFATSGPGATNLVTGIANAYFDSTPTMFLTGQVDTYSLKDKLPIRQRGFQETDMVSIVSSITKYAVRVDDPNEIIYQLEKAYYFATTGNPGPVLLDLPADVQRAEIDESILKRFNANTEGLVKSYDYENAVHVISSELSKASRPCFLVGNGVKQAGMQKQIGRLIEALNIPTVFSMPAFDVLPYNHRLNFGFIGANGHRYANFLMSKSNLIITIGSRLDLKQVGNNRDQFVPEARIIRIDIDRGNFAYKVHDNEIDIEADIREFVPLLINDLANLTYTSKEWVEVCQKLKKILTGYDDEEYTRLLSTFGDEIPDNRVITADVGQSELWVAQQLHVKKHQSVHASGGHGAMGYSLPAAIGCAYNNGKAVISFNGDGGIQMNIQELQFLQREQLPVMVVIMNNHSLGMIR